MWEWFSSCEDISQEPGLWWHVQIAEWASELIMPETFAKSGKGGQCAGFKKINGMKLSNQRDTGFYENQNLIGDSEATRMDMYAKSGTSAAARSPDPMSLSYPITRYRSRRP